MKQYVPTEIEVAFADAMLRLLDEACPNWDGKDIDDVPDPSTRVAVEAVNAMLEWFPNAWQAGAFDEGSEVMSENDAHEVFDWEIGDIVESLQKFQERLRLTYTPSTPNTKCDS